MDKSLDSDPSLFADSDILLGAWEAAQELEIDLRDSLRLSGIRQQQLLSPKTYLGYQQVVTFLNDVATRNQCPNFGFYVARHQPSLRFGVLTQLPRLCATVGEAVAKTFKYAKLYNQASMWQVCEEGDYIVMKRHQRVATTGSLVQLHQLAITLMIKASQSFLNENYLLTSVSFSHSQPDNYKIYQRYYRAPVYFNQEYDGYVFPKDYLSIPIETANPELLSIVEAHLDGLLVDEPGDDVICGVRAMIRTNLGTSLCNLDGISQLMNKHPRALQRILKEQGMGFRDLLNEVRQEVAEHYLLNSNITLVDLADMLGYNNVSAFSRAFKTFTGVSPHDWRLAYA
jgi:AraC-like DNA-binding protein